MVRIFHAKIRELDCQWVPGLQLGSEVRVEITPSGLDSEQRPDALAYHVVFIDLFQLGYTLLE